MFDFILMVKQSLPKIIIKNILKNGYSVQIIVLINYSLKSIYNLAEYSEKQTPHEGHQLINF